MKSDILHPIGVTETLDELFRRNAATSRARGESPAPSGEFVCNSAKDHNFGLIEGAPKATEHFTVEQLERAGLVGLYRGQPSRGATASQGGQR
jgi:hypothetical protein